MLAAPLHQIDDLVQVVNTKVEADKDPTKPYVGLEHMQSHSPALIGWATAQESRSTNSVFAAGDILFGKLRPNLRKSVLAPFDGYCSTDVLVLRGREGVDPRFVALLFRSEQIGAIAQATAIGTKMPRTSWKDLRSTKVFCPFKAEQSKLADIVDTLNTAIRRTEAIIEKLKQVKLGLQHDLLTRGVDENGNLRPLQSEAPHLYKRSPLGWIPKEWKVMSFGQLAFFHNGYSFKAEQWNETGLPIIRIQNLNGEPAFNYYEGPVKPDWHVLPGDLLFAWAGQRGVSFGARIWHGPSGVLNQHIFKVVPNVELVSRKFLFQLLRYYQSDIEDSAHGFKDSFLHVTRSELTSLLVALPSTVEQGREWFSIESECWKATYRARVFGASASRHSSEG
jgi:type I restriction enzyme, S subunit